MEEIRRQDRKLFLKELVRPGRLVFLLPIFLLFSAAVSSDLSSWAVVGMLALAWYVGSAWSDSVKRRFLASSFRMRWSACEERLEKFEQVLKKLRKEQVADLKEMPLTIRAVAQSVYIALRKADLVAHEIGQTELGGQAVSRGWNTNTSDPQSQALYRLADRNIAEYRAELAAVMAGVHRTEAQSEVFITTLDSLRMKMLGYRLIGRRPELPSQGFLEALAEARLQLQSIDTALEELELGHYPRQISVVPPPMPAEEVRRMEQNQ
ncbi:MAG: hypothetical protein ACO1SV_03860 [Fimbriimonas sp.]